MYELKQSEILVQDDKDTLCMLTMKLWYNFLLK
jgi:hypothetical protein